MLGVTHTHFERAFTSGRVIERGHERLTLETARVGTLEVGDAGLWVFDPGFARVGAPVEGLTPGHYTVDVALVHATPAGGGAARTVVAALRAVRADAEVTQWRDAQTVSCDSGWVALATRPDAEAPVPATEDTLHTMRPDIASSQAGFGDGGYGVFVGVDAGGQPVAVVVDYFVLVAPRELAVELPLAALSTPGDVTLPELDALGLSLRVAAPGTTDGDQPVWLVLDARRRTTPEVTGFELRATDQAGAPLFVGYGAQGLVWTYTRLQRAPARVVLALQAGVEAL